MKNKNANKKPFLIKDASLDVTDRSGARLKSDANHTFIEGKNIELKNLVDERPLAKDKKLEINRKTDREFLIESIKCAIPVDKRLNYEYQLETRINTGIPRRFFDLLAISQDSRQKYIKLSTTLKIIDVLLSILAIFVIVLSAVENTTVVSFYNILINEFNLRDENNSMRLLIVIFTFFSILLIYKRYTVVVAIHIIRIGSLARKDSIGSRGLWWKLFIEILFHLVFIPPYIEHHSNINGSIYVEYDYTKLFNLDGLKLLPGQKLDTTMAEAMKSPTINVQLYYNTSALITFFILFRIYHLFRLNNTLSYWATPKANSICKIMNTKADFSFNLRATLKHRPFFSLTFSVLFLIVTFGIAMQIFEFYNAELIYALDDTKNQHARTMQKFSNIYNSFWLIVVTMTTLGYGDIYPTTYFGRVISIVACIFGTFVLSSIIVFLSNFIAFDDIERFVYNSVVKEKSNSKMLKRKASVLVGKLIRYNYLRTTQHDTSAGYRLHIWIDMQYDTKTFKMLRVGSRKAQVDLGALMENIDDQMKIGVDPLRDALNVYNKNRNTNDKTGFVLEETNEISGKFMKNSVQMWNLLKILNKDRYLSGLNNINEVYDQTANIIEEIIYYHNNKGNFTPEEKKLLEENRDNYSSSSSGGNSEEDDEYQNIRA